MKYVHVGMQVYMWTSSSTQVSSLGHRTVNVGWGWERRGVARNRAVLGLRTSEILARVSGVGVGVENSREKR